VSHQYATTPTTILEAIQKLGAAKNVETIISLPSNLSATPIPVTGTTINTLLMGQQIAGNRLVQTMKVSVRASFSVIVGSNQLTLTLQLGGVVIATPISGLALTGTYAIRFTAEIVALPSGSVKCDWDAVYGTAAAAGSELVSGIGLSSNPALAFYAQWQTANADTITQDLMIATQ
jgi:hypothetical protein